MDFKKNNWILRKKIPPEIFGFRPAIFQISSWNFIRFFPELFFRFVPDFLFFLFWFFIYLWKFLISSPNILAFFLMFLFLSGFFIFISEIVWTSFGFFLCFLGILSWIFEGLEGQSQEAQRAFIWTSSCPWYVKNVKFKFHVTF